MTYKEIRDALDGLQAYDMGATDSGIHDDALRERVKRHMQGLELQDHDALIKRLCLEYVSDEGVWKGQYSPEDLKDFLVWLYEDLHA